MKEYTSILVENGKYPKCSNGINYIIKTIT